MEKLTLEDKILGRTEPKPITEYEKTALTSAVKYKIKMKDKDNESIVTGETLNSILSTEKKQLVREGDKVIEYNGFVIERIENDEIEEEETPKPRRRRANNG